MPVPRWDIFCRVVDNYGDAGVAWRLARELAAEHALDVTLWQDDLAPLARIAPGIECELPAQRAMDVTIRRWSEPFASAEVADVIVEAFGCGLPERYVAKMAERAVAPAWFVLEYLSAESWVDRSHGLASPHPSLPLSRRFWFPGFTQRTGGLLRERDLLDARDRFIGDGRAQREFWASLAMPSVAGNEMRVSLFCYSNPALPALCDAWAKGDIPVTCIVPEGVAVAELDRWTGGGAPPPGAALTRGALTLRSIPFIAQDDYDRLLWSCDVNFVRGEDSFVRAQWAAHPLVWHIYPQAERAHLRKLDAFLDLYLASVDSTLAGSIRSLWDAWNGAPNSRPIHDVWGEFSAAGGALRRRGAAWSTELARLPELASGLVEAAAAGYN
ncbi:MAG TPA: elongation factor P maturation arginine rhamnosyltransferase EarP [Casimicrobiaceae bacterium]|nr:elongation factor P maturation arginine rhamnosyltransferase EarP [Casimicrobiaceae bacterium]